MLTLVVNLRIQSSKLVHSQGGGVSLPITVLNDWNSGNPHSKGQEDEDDELKTIFTAMFSFHLVVFIMVLLEKWRKIR